MDTTRFLDRPHGRLAYDDRGDGPLVVCVPGMGETRATFRHLAPALVDAGYRVVTLDVRGHGESSTGWPDHSVAAIGADIVALIGDLDAGAASLVGHSMAAAAAVWAAAEAPDLVAATVLVGPFAREVPAPAWQRPLARMLFSRPWGARAWGWWYGRLYVSPPSDHASHRAAVVANLAEAGRLEALQAMVQASKAEAEARLAAVRSPTLVVMGAADPDFADPAAEAAIVADRTSGETLLVDGTGHYPHSERPEVVAPALVSFLRTRASV